MPKTPTFLSAFSKKLMKLPFFWLKKSRQNRKKGLKSRHFFFNEKKSRQKHPNYVCLADKNTLIMSA